MNRDDELVSGARTAEAIAMNLKLAACPICQGTGKVDAVRAEWIVIGEQMREDRESRAVTLEDEARHRAMPYGLLLQMERGLVRPIVREDLGL